MRTTVLLLLLALPFVFPTADRATGGDMTVSATVGGPIQREPVLLFDVTGGTLTGVIHERFTVYNDGLVTGGDCGSVNGFGSASPADVATLRADLIAAGGLMLPDQPIAVSDVPLTTITVLKGGTNARAHTFSYWLPIGEYAPIATVIGKFKSEQTLSCPGGGGSSSQ